MRRLISLAAVAVILTVLMGCGNKDDSNASDPVNLPKKTKGAGGSGGGSPQSGG